jgi:hypothetical protein
MFHCFFMATLHFTGVKCDIITVCFAFLRYSLNMWLAMYLYSITCESIINVGESIIVNWVINLWRGAKIIRPM